MSIFFETGGTSISFVMATIISFIIRVVVCMIICAVLVKKTQAPKGLIFLGILGIFGVVLCSIITMIRRYSSTGSSSFDGQGNYGNSSSHSTFGEQGSYGSSNTYSTLGGNYNNTSGTQLNSCRTHNGQNETYDSVYGKYDKYKTGGSYNLNGKIVNEQKNVCHHCGAKLKAFATYCDTCGSRV